MSPLPGLPDMRICREEVMRGRRRVDRSGRLVTVAGVSYST